MGWLHRNRGPGVRSFTALCASAAALLFLPKLGLSDQKANFESLLSIAAPWLPGGSEPTGQHEELLEQLRTQLEDCQRIRDEYWSLLRDQLRQHVPLVINFYGEPPSPPANTPQKGGA